MSEIAATMDYGGSLSSTQKPSQVRRGGHGADDEATRHSGGCFSLSSLG